MFLPSFYGFGVGIIGIMGILNVVKQSGLIAFLWALCFLSARNDQDSKWQEIYNGITDMMRIRGLTKPAAGKKLGN